MLIYCPVCDSAVEKESGVDELLESHNESRHDGEQAAVVFESGIVTPDEVNELYDGLRDQSREHKERFARRVLKDDRFKITDDEKPSREEFREWAVRT